MCNKQMIKDRSNHGRVFDPTIELADNGLLKVYPELFDEWDFEKNDELGFDVYKVTKGSGKKVWWICPKCESSYDMSPDKRTKDRSCSYCAGKKVNHTNSLATIRPKIAKEWHPTLNGDLTPHDVTSNNSKLVWWYCEKCKSSYDMRISHKRTTNCPYCSGQRVNHTNSLATLNPQLAKEWHPIKNGEMTPNDIAPSSNQKMWWRCEKEHEWYTVVGSRNEGFSCPYCSNQKILVGFNDMWTTNPELASMLANPEDGYKYTQGSNKKINWKCEDCNSIIRNKSISNVKNRAITCPSCSDGISYPEKFMYGLLMQLGVKFDIQKTFVWSKSRRYDFYLSEFSMIIEMHGEQHYRHTGRGRALEEEQENDMLKERLAKENGIENYIIIDARESNLDWIRNSIYDSILMRLLNFKSVDWDKIEKDSIQTLIKTVCELWNNGLMSTNSIGNQVKLTRGTVRRYLKRGAELGWCDYVAVSGVEYLKRKVVRISPNSNELVEYESISDAMRKNGFNSDSGIIKSCQGKIEQYAGFRFMYHDDFTECTDIKISNT